MRTTIKNVALLDVRKAKDEVLAGLDAIKNVAVLLTNEEVMKKMSHIQQTNIASVMKIPMDAEVIVINDEFTLEPGYLYHMPDRSYLMVSGSLTLHKEVTPELLTQKIEKLIVNGYAYMPKELYYALATKLEVNGELITYPAKAIVLREDLQVTTNKLKEFPGDSVLACRNVVMARDLDQDLFQHKIKKIIINGSLLYHEGQVDLLSEKVENFFEVKKSMVPADHEYMASHDTFKIDESFLEDFEDAKLYIDGEVIIEDIDFEDLSDHLSSLCCHQVTIEKKGVRYIKPLLCDPSTPIKLLDEYDIVNYSKTRISKQTLAEYPGRITLGNYGKMILDDDFSLESFRQQVSKVTNYGILKVPEHLYSAVIKIADNYGMIRRYESEAPDPEEKTERELYANAAYVEL